MHVGEKSRELQTNRTHLSHLDGLRGLSALYVVLVHSLGNYRYSTNITLFPPGIRRLIGLTSFGQAAVVIFIVLSGYCLTMPLVMSNTTSLRGGVQDYLKRRARRILPVYYAALGISLLLIAAVPAMNRISNSEWDGSLPAYKWDVILSHLLLIHNLNDKWLLKIDYPMWSVATEWQIYFVFALILLPLWRSFGLTTTLITATLLGIAPHWLFRGRLDGAHFEFIGLFAYGMAAAIISFSKEPKLSILRKKYPWGALALLSLLPIAYFAKYRWNGSWLNIVLGFLVVGLAAVFLLIYCANSPSASQQKSTPWVMLFLTSKPCVSLGSFSYSLYLIHAPVLAICTIIIRRFHLPLTTEVAPFVIVSVPLCLVAAYLFYQLFEKPFLAKRRAS